MSIIPKPEDVAPKINSLRERLVPVVELLAKGAATVPNVSSKCNVTESSAKVYVSQAKKHLGLEHVPLQACRKIVAEAMQLRPATNGGAQTSSNGHAIAKSEAIKSRETNGQAIMRRLSTTEINMLAAYGKSIAGSEMAEIIGRAVHELRLFGDVTNVLLDFHQRAKHSHV
ncbi:MAG TPA: hypothetical protein VMU25_01205 [Candidatus Paceibacterota bacterium]|nr:hypothetical protein [Candidatus Paceibacterota bacterium]